MFFHKIEDNKLLFYAPLSECLNCHRLMVRWYTQVLDGVFQEANRHGIEREAYSESGICLKCVAKGGFQKQCDCCAEYREFPKEFCYQITHFAKYVESETTYEYICRDCLVNKPNLVIKMLADSDDTVKL